MYCRFHHLNRRPGVFHTTESFPQMQNYQPVGFYTLPSTPTSVCWHKDSSRVIVTCIGGEVAQVDLSGGHLDAVDSSQVR